MRKRRKQRPRRKHIPINIPVTVRTRLATAKDPWRHLARARHELGLGLYAELIDWISSRGWLEARIRPPSLPMRLHELFPDPDEDRHHLGPLPAREEIVWAVLWLSRSAGQMARFVIATESFNHHFFRGDFVAAAEALDGVEEKFGWSFWLIRRRIALLQAADGLEAQKRYAERIRQGASPVVAITTHFTSVLNEPSVSPVSFPLRLQELFDASNLNEEIKAFFRHLIIPSESLSPREMGHVLGLAWWSSNIDLYESLINIGQQIAAGGAPDLTDTYRDATAHLAIRTRDSRLAAVQSALGATDPSAISLGDRPRSVAAFEHLLAGNSREAYESALEAFRQSTDDADALEIAAAALAGSAQTESPSASFPERIVGNMAAVIRTGAGAEAEFHELTRVAINLYGTPAANGILGFLARMGSSDPVPLDSAVSKAYVSIPTVHPARSSYVPLGSRDNFLTHIRAFGCASAWYANQFLQENLWDSPPEADISDVVGTIVRAESAFRYGHCDIALEAAACIVESADVTYRTRALRLIPHCHLRLGAVDEAVRFIAQVHLDTPNLNSIMPHAEVAAEVTQAVKKRMKAELALPIFWDIVATHGAARKEYERRFSSEDLLGAYGLSRPSELVGIANQFDRAALLYFLRDVCIEPVISTFRVFKRSRQAAEERIRICHTLAELDPDNAETYQSEVADLLRRLDIQRRLGEVDQSRIYIDRDGVRRTARAGIRENFNRYIAFLRSGVDTEEVVDDDSRREPVIASLEGDDASGERELVELERTLPRNERRALLLTMLEQIRAEYALSTRHGLNKYLSSRVRHVALAGQLRKALDDQGLITEFDTATNEYEPNEEWIGGVDDQNVLGQLVDLFDRFARGFDGLITTINREWLQVRTQPDQPGMFDFPLNVNWVNSFENVASASITLDEFMDAVLTQFDVILDHNLTSIRNRFEGEVRDRIDDLVREFQKGVERVTGYDSRRELAAAIQLAGTELQNNVGRVAAWFRTPGPTTSEPFLVEEAIEISAVAVPSGRRRFTASIVTEDGASSKISGILFQIYVDILTTLFANMIRYSGTDEVQARISIHHLENRIGLRVENDVIGGVTEEERSRVESIRQKLADKQLALSAVSEGGTGLLKIASYLEHVGNYSRTLEFGFIGDDGFFVEFEIATTVEGP